MRIIYCLSIALLVSSPAYAQLAVELAPDQQALLQSSDPKLAANKKLLFDFWTEVFQTRDMSKAPDYMHEDYMQHNPAVPTGRAPFVNFFGTMPKQEKKNTIDNLVTIVAEGDLVVLAFKVECKDPRKEGATYTTTWFDMLRVKDGKVSEHWDYGTIGGSGNAPDCQRQ